MIERSYCISLQNMFRGNESYDSYSAARLYKLHLFCFIYLLVYLGRAMSPLIINIVCMYIFFVGAWCEQPAANIKCTCII